MYTGRSGKCYRRFLCLLTIVTPVYNKGDGGHSLTPISYITNHGINEIRNFRSYTGVLCAYASYGIECLPPFNRPVYSPTASTVYLEFLKEPLKNYKMFYWQQDTACTIRKIVFLPTSQVRCRYTLQVNGGRVFNHQKVSFDLFA